MIKPVKPFNFVNDPNGTADAGEVNEDFDILYAKIGEVVDLFNTLAGTKADLDKRLAVSMNGDGTMKVGLTTGQGWVNPVLPATYVSATQFTVIGDHTDIYLVDRRLKITLAGGVVYSTITTVGFNAGTGLTTVTVGAVLTNPITSIEHSVVIPGAGSNVPTAITANITGNAATATALQTARTIGGVSFNGSAPIDLPGVNITGNQNTTANANTATTLLNARTIGGVSFNGSANINLPGVNTSGNQNTTGSAATLTTPRTIGGVLFNGSANIDLPGVNITGNQNTTGSAGYATAAGTSSRLDSSYGVATSATTSGAWVQNLSVRAVSVTLVVSGVTNSAVNVYLNDQGSDTGQTLILNPAFQGNGVTFNFPVNFVVPAGAWYKITLVSGTLGSKTVVVI